MKKSIRQWIITATSVALLALPTITSISAQEGVIAKINDTTITAEDLYQTMKDQYGAAALRSKIIESVLVNNVKDSEAAKSKAKEEVQAQIKELGGEEIFQQFLSYQQLGSLEQYQYQLYIRNMLQEVVDSYLDLSDEAIQKFYDSDYQPMMEAQHILVDTEDEAKAAIERINNGEEFDAVAQEISKDGSAQNGGLLAPFSAGQMVPEFEEAVKNLKNGEMTPEPVKSQYGFHIIKAINNGEKKPLADSKDAVIEAYKQSKYSDSDYTYGIVGELIKKANLSIEDESLKTAVDDLIALADKKDQPAEKAPAEEAPAEEAPAEEAPAE